MLLVLRGPVFTPNTFGQFSVECLDPWASAEVVTESNLRVAYVPRNGEDGGLAMEIFTMIISDSVRIGERKLEIKLS